MLSCYSMRKYTNIIREYDGFNIKKVSVIRFFSNINNLKLHFDNCICHFRYFFYIVDAKKIFCVYNTNFVSK